MLSRVVYKKQTGRRLLTALATGAIVSGTLLFASSALAVHDDGSFQLDRNAQTSDPGDPATTGEDWDVVQAGTDTARSSSFTFDGIGPTIFTGGGSKDALNTTSWQHKSGSTPPKDELLDGFAARYGDNVYFGADRYANSGDAVMGFWFFQQEVVPQPDGTFGPGEHENGDVLVLSDFSGGGANVTIRVFQWHSPGGAINGTLDLVAGTLDTPADCVGPPAVPNGDSFCATVNTEVEIAPWPFAPKSAPEGFFQPGELYEGGIDLAFLGLEDECFTSFLAETRSSTSVSATLKDFVGGVFEPCVADVVTTPSDASITLGQSTSDSALITGTGSTQAPTGTMDFFICSPLQLTAGACATGGTEVNGLGVGALNLPAAVTPVAGTSTSTSISSAFTPTSVGTWCWRGVYSGDDNYPTDTDASTGECFLVNTIPTITSTAQSWTPNDSATITTTGPAGYNLTGSVTFTLYGPADSTCAGTAVYQEIVNIPANEGLGATVTTTNGDGVGSGLAANYVVINGASEGTYSWKVEYTPAASDTAHTGSGSSCHVENSSVSITE